jgi:hypothetical protein
VSGALDLAREAHDYAALGWAVFPLQPGQKKPYGFTTGLKAASDDPALAAARWAGRASLPMRDKKSPDERMPRGVVAQPASNIGMATGAASRCWVLDVDGPEGIESLLALAAANGRLPATVRQHTGGGGGQLFYRWPGTLPWGVEIRNGASKFAAHLDVRGAGGYVVLPPSLHPSGRRYEWAEGCAPWEIEPAPAPWWLLRIVAPPVERPPAPAVYRDGPRHPAGYGYERGALDAARAEVGAAPPGKQNETLHRNAYGIGRLVAGGELDRGEALRGLVSAGLSMATGDPRRPWTERDVSDVVERAFQRAQGDPKRAPEGGRS